jgi:lauroyl/myristoyl acyltransferase
VRGVAMLSDQDAGSDGVVIDFLGRPASTAK